MYHIFHKILKPALIHSFFAEDFDCFVRSRAKDSVPEYLAIVNSNLIVLIIRDCAITFCSHVIVITVFVIA